MKIFLILVLVACLLCRASCQFIWDASQIVIFQADDAFAMAFEMRGNDGMCALMSTDTDTGRQMLDTRTPPSATSKYVRVINRAWKNLLRLWYWHEQDPLPKACDFQEPWAQAIAEIAPSGEPWRCHRYIHSDPTSTLPLVLQSYRPGRPGAKTYYATGASVNIALLRHWKTGFIIFQPSNSPKFAAAKNWGRSDMIQERELPKFRLPSDFMWWQWNRLGSKIEANIKYCGVQEVNDGATLKLIARYLLQRGIYDLESWPASSSVWSTATPEGRGLLGSPAASQCAAFLWQHKPNLGIKYIVNVKVFRGGLFYTHGVPHRLPQMLFEISNVPSNLIKGRLPQVWMPPPPIAVPGVAPGPYPVMPGVPGPSTPRPIVPRPPPFEEPEPDWGILEKRVLNITYTVKQEGSGKSFVRSHMFCLA